MQKMPIDLRSDVVSIPPPEMLVSMSTCQVGDDVYQDDPTANKFQQQAAKYFGFQDCLLLPSTTMANLVAILLMTKPGDEVIIWGNSHTIQRESAGIALIGAVQTRQVLRESGVFDISDVKKKIRKSSQNVHFPDTAVIAIQNPTFTGEVWPIQTLSQLNALASNHNVKILLDGARILNAIAHYSLTKPFDPSSISSYCSIMTMCLSKGLCCPFGSLIFGSKEDIKQARQIRKSLGGGMRQVGIVGAAGLYAFQKLIPQIAIDNQMALYMGSMLCQIKGIQIDCSKIQSNMVNFQIGIEDFDHSGYFFFLQTNGVRIKPFNQDRQEYRMVTHRTIRTHECDKFIKLTAFYLSQYEKKPETQKLLSNENKNGNQGQQKSELNQNISQAHLNPDSKQN